MTFIEPTQAHVRISISPRFQKDWKICQLAISPLGATYDEEVKPVSAHVHMEQPHQQQISGTAVHVGDCFIWVTIAYLDSRTDYREYLPFHQPVSDSNELVMLDDVTPSRLGILKTFTAVVRAIWTCLFCD